MEVCWRLYRFDYARYVALRPVLRTAVTADALAAISDSPEAAAIASSVEDGEVGIDEARQALLQILCCPGDPVELSRTFVRCLPPLARSRPTEAAAELLEEALTGGRNLEPWLQPARDLLGFLTPDETLTVSSGMSAARGKRSRRRGGVVGAVAHFARLLLDRGPAADEMLALTGDLFAAAAARGEGVAVFRA